jgi:hypothetical protein
MIVFKVQNKNFRFLSFKNLKYKEKLIKYEL